MITKQEIEEQRQELRDECAQVDKEFKDGKITEHTRFQRIDELFETSRDLDDYEDRYEKNLNRRKNEFRARIAQDPIGWPLDSPRRKRADAVALRGYLRDGSIPEKFNGLMVRLAEQSTDPTSGGYTIPKSITTEIEIALKSLGGMWAVANQVKTEKGNLLSWPTTNDTANEAYIIDENANMTTSAQAVAFGVEEFLGFKYTSGMIEVPYELLEDGGSLFEQTFIEVLSQRIWRGTNRHFSVGNGSTQPNGIENAAVYGVSSADDQVISRDDIINLLHSVDPSYRKHFMFSDSVLKHLRGLKEGTTNAPLLPELNQGLLLGLPFVVNNHLAVFVPATGNDNKKLMYAGDFSKYKARTVRDIAIRRIQGSTSDKDCVSFAAIWRVDGDLLNAGTDPVKYMRMGAT